MFKISFDVDMMFHDYTCSLRLTSTAASIASASVPSAALVLLHIVLGAIHVPIRDASLLWAVDWLM